MHTRILVYKFINRIISADITRVLVMDKIARQAVQGNCVSRCQWLTPDELEPLTHDSYFAISQQFIADFKQLGFLGVSAMIDRTVVGILFLTPDDIVARHNSGGTTFNGIGGKLPGGVYYLFKVAVKPGFRGMRINAAMMDFVFEQSGADMPTTLVTTTDWTNHAFLRSVENYGFRRCGFASEFVVAGRHFYQLPDAIELSTATGDYGQAEKRTIRFCPGK